MSTCCIGKLLRFMPSLLGLPAPTMTDPRRGEGVRVPLIEKSRPSRLDLARCVSRPCPDTCSTIPDFETHVDRTLWAAAERWPTGG